MGIKTKEYNCIVCNCIIKSKLDDIVYIICKECSPTGNLSFLRTKIDNYTEMKLCFWIDLLTSKLVQIRTNGRTRDQIFDELLTEKIENSFAKFENNGGE